jgi:hypothetical protein
MAKLLDIEVVFETPEVPKLPVNPLRNAASKTAVCQSFIRVRLVLLAIAGPLPPVLIPIPDAADSVKVGSSWILKPVK